MRLNLAAILAASRLLVMSAKATVETATVSILERTDVAERQQHSVKIHRELGATAMSAICLSNGRPALWLMAIGLT